MDFHCHVDLYPDAKAVYREALRRNQFTWLVTTSPRAYAATRQVLPATPQLAVSPGLHPEIAQQKEAELHLLLTQIETTRLVGEVGLDGTARHALHRAVQFRVFSAVLSRCQAVGGRILSLHSRAAAQEVLDLLDRHPGFGTAVLHWFTGTVGALRRAESSGCWFSVGPAMLASGNGLKLLQQMPRDRVVPESDGPFAKIDGAPIMPWEAVNTADALAKAWCVSTEEAAAILLANGRRLIAMR